jgi:hypothetical protein
MGVSLDRATYGAVARIAAATNVSPSKTLRDYLEGHLDELQRFAIMAEKTPGFRVRHPTVKYTLVSLRDEPDEDEKALIAFEQAWNLTEGEDEI